MNFKASGTTHAALELLMENMLLFNNLVILDQNSLTTNISLALYYWHWLMLITNLFMLMLVQLVKAGDAGGVW